MLVIERMNLLSDNKLVVYHTGARDLKSPDPNYISYDKKGRERKFDFGRGFYVTPNIKTAFGWGTTKQNIISHGNINSYELNLEGLKVYDFKNPIEWMSYILYSRGHYQSLSSNQLRRIRELDLELSKYDILKGEIADDRLFQIINLLKNDTINSNQVIICISSMRLGTQYKLQSDKSIQQCKFKSCRALTNKDYKQGLDYMSYCKRRSEDTINKVLKENQEQLWEDLSNYGKR